MTRPSLDAATGLLLIAVTGLVAGREWGAPGWVGLLADLAVLPLVVLLALRAPPARLAFVAVAAALTLAAFVFAPDPWGAIDRALATGAFIAAFFTALATLRTAAGGSPSIEACGRYLAQQPPGRRYAALSAGGALFGMMLNYGSIALLGTLAEASARSEPDPEIRAIRLRRMLLAVQRGFISTLAWSPLAFAIAISSAVIPGADWAAALPGLLVNGVILWGTGWALDTLFKPRLSGPRPPRVAPEGGPERLRPLLILLALVFTLVGGLQLLTGVRTVGVVMLAIPALSLAWIALQTGGAVAPRARGFATAGLPAYRGEILLLVMAGVIGGLGGGLLAPLVAAAGLHPEDLPVWVLLPAVVCVIPIMGQLGMNPILSVSLFAPLLVGAAGATGLTPEAMMVAVTAGWALTGASSPFTATTLMIGAMAKTSALAVGVRWNGVYTLVCLVLLSVWSVVYAAL